MRATVNRVASAFRWAVPWTLLLAGFVLAGYYAVRLLGPHADQSPYYAILGRPRTHGILSGLFLAAVFAGAVRVVPFTLSNAAAWKRLVALVGLGFALQWAFFVSDGRGFALMHERLWDAGAPPAEFIRIAKEPLPPGLFARYDELGEERHWYYSRMKGPGLLYAYRGLVRLSEGPVGQALGDVVATGPTPTLDERITGVIYVVFPLFTFLTVIPLFFLARALADERTASAAALFYVLSPSAAIVVMHLDGALYPLVTTASAALVAAWGRNLLAIFVAGLLLSSECLFSFSPLPEAGVIGLFVFASALFEAGVPMRRRLLAVALRSIAFAIGLVLLHAILALAVHYHPIDRLHTCLTRYDAWEPPDRSLCKYYNFLQFTMWLGPALAALVLGDLLHLFTSRELRSARALFAAACCVAMIYSTLHLTGEVMRLWLPMIPLLAPLAAATFTRLRENGARWLLPAVSLCQIATTFVIMYRYEP
jgi:hypothetical protein